ncbi:MAG TPA: Rieske (2Fe-2S) protein [Stellaceae bacterium]|nr:Rieske (2Fe-2S) protein [Stellaceae bacterium]
MRRRRLCRAEEVPEGGARGFRFGSGADFAAVLVARKAGALFAYDNACPHLGTPLDFLPDRFLDRAGTHLLCGTHGARFRIEDGYCVEGPCAGRSLRRRAVAVEADEILLVDDPPL